MGADTVDFSIPDCIYRRSSAGELLYTEDVFVPIHPFDRDLIEEIAAALTSELQPEDVLVSPLAIGGHLDHNLTRLAAQHVGRPLYYYADIPYLIDHPEMLVPTTQGLKETLHRVTKKGLAVWQNSIATYASQMGMLFETPEKMKEVIHHTWESLGGIRLWSAPVLPLET